MNKIRFAPLSEVCNYINEKIAVSELTTDNYISTENMLPGKSGVIRASSLPAVSRVSKYGVGDVLISNIRPYFKKIWYASQCGGVSNDVLILRNKPNYKSRFLYYVLADDSFFAYSMASSKGTKMPRGDKDAIMKYEVPLIDTNVQEKIAKILSQYDYLIETNSRRIDILEDMAQRLYREWFVHFRFPGHERVKLIESEIGLIPESWKITPFFKAIEANPKSKKPTADSYSFVEMAGLSNNLSSIQIKERRTSFSGSKFIIGDTLVARITPCLENGKTGFVQCLKDGEVGTGSTEFIVFRSKMLTPEFVYLLARQDNFREILIKSMTGASGRQRADIRSLKGYSVVVPPENILEAFSRFIQPCYSEVQYLNVKNDTLRKTRDLLLPRLISGDIDVSELDIPIEGSVDNG
ncbi:MAG: restriction endonuclease subunit S [Erysipelotrichaceae bacterium]|nr:restriction endonuclease subunit S [Erysipelotrichaceae bacterium]